MVLKFYNTLTKRKEKFIPLKKGEVRMYNCGPTVYFYAHIGNFRAYIFADILRRYLEYSGLKVKQVINITDVGHMTNDADSGEDKIEKEARKEKKDPYEIARFYTQAFIEDSEKLNLRKPSVTPRATEHIKEMITMIEKLIENGHAYTSNGNVFYSVKSFKDYGKLSGNTLDNLRIGARLEEHPDKKDPRDFALWLKDPNHIMQWDSPWGKGYPGWHIECSAMSTKYLGSTLDIHTGGEDNIFPHHEAEIAQSEGASKKKFVMYWMHTRHLMINGEKMSKSKGNFFTFRDLLGKAYKPKSIRYVLLSAQYRTRLNFTEKGIREADEIIRKLEEFAISSREGKDGTGMNDLIKKAKTEFKDTMDDNLNTPKALAVIFEFIHDANKMGAGKMAYETILDFDKILGLDLEKSKKKWFSVNEADTDVKKLILEREKYRKEKNWKEADKIRDILKKRGIMLEDTAKGVRWKKT